MHILLAAQAHIVMRQGETLLPTLKDKSTSLEPERTN